jgi:hypothetical protein
MISAGTPRPWDEIATLESEVARLTKQANDARSDTGAERTKSRDASFRQSLSDSLARAP